ncbi:MAG TPA: type I-U CRISPR-associated RAMP protein Csb1/Cas7u [Candidatus Sulfotelmatobacter sp.]|nr:type I-U CRISPR-associated RAMP protein Csb1/Cas7u [Candidatus Sulfotelmatobacter sp.]
MTLTIEKLLSTIDSDAAFRRRRRLQPMEGPGAKIFPPTYPGQKKDDAPRHVFERRRINGGELWCVLVDSVQSQSNRLEEFLLEAVRQKIIELPYVSVDFSHAKLDGLTEITSLEAPHRLFDAILRDSELGGKPFMKSDKGLALVAAKPSDASAIFELSPTALLFGVWNSTGEGGGLGAKFPRCLVSELIGVNVPVDEEGDIVISAAKRTGSRIDPLGVLRRVEVYKSKEGWDVDPKKAGKDAKKVRPSEINHGNIAPTVQSLGVTCDYIEQTSVVTLAGLRRLRFGSADRTSAARAHLASLGLVALLEQDARGYALRSRCDLVSDGSAPLELVKCDGSTEQVDLDLAAARALYADCVAAVRKAGFTFSSEPLKLTPQAKLVQIVQKSRELALAGEGGEAVEAAG